MGLIRTFIKRPVTTIMFISVFVVLGLVSYNRMVVDLLPKLEFPLVQVIVTYPGAGPEEIETQVVKKIEDEVSNISDIKKISSKIFENYGWIIVEFNLGVDVNIKALDVKDKIELIKRDFPDAVEDPIIAKFDPLSTPVLELAMISKTMTERDLYELADKKLKNMFGQVNGVAKVEIVGGAKRQINIWVKQEKLAQYGLSMTDILAILGRENLDVPAGNIYKKKQEIGVRFKGEAKSVKDIAAITFNALGHGVIKISDIARIEDGSEQSKSIVRYNKQPGVLLRIFKRADGNSIKVADEVYKKMDIINQEKILPKDVKLHIAIDASTFIRDSVKNARNNIILGVAFTSLILWIFLGNLRITFVAAIILPTSIISAFMLMDFAGFTINIMTMLALGVSIGALVANAIVVLENISRYIDRGSKPSNAAVNGTKEVAVAVMASAGTNIVVFTPIAFMGGIVGQFFFQFGLTVVFATIFSLIASFSLTPMLSSIFLKSKEAQKRKSKIHEIFTYPLTLSSKFVEWLQNSYGSFLKSVIKHSILTIILTLLALIGSYLLKNYVGGEFFPASDQSVITVSAQLPKGATRAAAEEMIHKIEKIIVKEVPEHKDFVAYAGGETSGFDKVTLAVRLKTIEERKRSDKDIIYALQSSMAKVSGGEIIILGKGEGKSRSDLDIDIFGPDYKKLAALSRQVRQLVFDTGNFRSVYDNYRDPKDEIHFIPDAYRRAAYGIPNALIGLNMRYSIEGEKSSVLRVGGEEYNIKIRFDKPYRDSFEDLKTYRIPTRKGLVPLSHLGTFKRTKGISDLTRKNKKRVITLECFISHKSMTENMVMLKEKLKQIKFPKGYSYKFAGQAELQQETNSNIQIAFILAIILTYMLLAAILNSFIHPLTIMITVPLGLTGVILALFFSGITINLMSMMAIVMLVGIVVNNAILIIDYILQKLNSNQKKLEIIVQEASLAKFRAIIMTNTAIVAGIFPQLLGGSGVEFMVPMAAATIGGVLVSTLFTLFTIPALFLVIEKSSMKIKSLLNL